MPTRVKNQAVKLYDASETLFNDKTSRCEWHQDYFPLVTCNDISEIILNMDEIANDVGKDSDFSFVVTGTITNIISFFVDDAAATFISDNVEVGMYINVIDGITGGILFSQKIIDVVSETQLEVTTTGGFSSGEDYEVSNWAYFGDVTTVNNSFEITSLGISSSFIFQETLTVGVLYKIEFTITFVDVDLDGNTLNVLIGSNNVLSLFESEIQAKKYTVFGIADATVFRITTGNSIKLTIQSIVVSEMAETTFEVRNCDTDGVEYSSVANDACRTMVR